MKKITIKQFNKLKLVKPKYKSDLTEKIEHRLKQCKIGEGIILKKQEWISNANLYSFIYRLSQKRNKKFTVRTLKDSSGWALLRIK